MDNLPPLREVIARHGLDARKSLGQHFLLDLNLTGRIARAAGELSAGTVIEVGPGPGGLTRALLAAGARQVIAIEKDARCLAALAEIQAAYPGRLDILAADALTVDTAQLGVAPRRIVANLPYNVATPLLIGWLRNAAAFTQMTLMFQKEVADRLIAVPNTKDYGRLSVMTQWRATARLEFAVDRRAFTPPPQVTSAVIGLTPRPPVANDPPWDAMERVVAAAFGQRRKMLRAALKSLAANAEDRLARAGIDPTRRAESLTVKEFVALTREFPESAVRNSSE